MDKKVLFIPGEVPSEKNSKRAFVDEATGKIRVQSSKFTNRYVRNKRNYGSAYRRQWHEMTKGKEYPLTVEFYFIRETEGDFDYNNLSQVLTDLMKKWGWIPDDSMRYVIPNFSRQYAVNPFNPGVEISVQ